MKGYRKHAIAVGVLFIIGTGSGILSGFLILPLQTTASHFQQIVINETQWISGSLLILLMGLSLSMIPVILYPILRKQSEIFAMGAILFRGVLEMVMYTLHVVINLIVLSIGQTMLGAGATDQTGLAALGSALMASIPWIDLLLAVAFSIGSLMLNGLFFQMRLVPPLLSGWGVVGSVLYFGAALISLLGTQHIAFSLDSALGFLIAPLALQEMVIALWLIIKGFSPSPKLAAAN